MQYTDETRGKIYHEKAARRILLFEGLRWGRITPTDIDLFTEFRDELFVFGEIKHGHTDAPRGQELALERLCDAVTANGRYGLVLIANYHGERDVAARDCTVTKYRWQHKWRHPTSRITVREAIDYVRNEVMPEVRKKLKGGE